MRSGKAEQSQQAAAPTRAAGLLPCSGPSYLERLGVLYLDEIRLTIVMELFMREMGVVQFYETFGGSSKDSVRRHFKKLVEYGWLRRVREAPTGQKGRPEVLYRATEQAVIDTETWSRLPVSVRDVFTVMLLEELGTRLGEALKGELADARTDQVAFFKTLRLDELSWCKAHEAIEKCFQTLRQEQIDAKIRLSQAQAQPLQMIVNLAAFEASGPYVNHDTALPKAKEAFPPPPWPLRIGKVLADELNLAIVDELNQAAMTPSQLHAVLGGATSTTFLRKCKRLTKLGWAVDVDVKTGGELHGANLYQFRAAVPNISESDIFRGIPASARTGRSWNAIQPFMATSLSAIDAGTFNSRFDRHLTLSPLLVDEIGWRQVNSALRTFLETLADLEADCAHRFGGKQSKGFPAAFLAASFQIPLRDIGP
ncbi:MAG TPA: hypothetical protein VFY75_00505 [Solirubrobacterales bacterium]|nr:hypothetical protein [Solirubrobacterales bacterium]